MVLIGGFLDTGKVWAAVEAILLFGLMGAVAALFQLGVLYVWRRAHQMRGRAV
jgi:hypothetical protein